MTFARTTQQNSFMRDNVVMFYNYAQYQNDTEQITFSRKVLKSKQHYLASTLAK